MLRMGDMSSLKEMDVARWVSEYLYQMLICKGVAIVALIATFSLSLQLVPDSKSGFECVKSVFILCLYLPSYSAQN